MVINWNGEGIDTKVIDVNAGRVKVGDFILNAGELKKVVTVQKACPYFENINHYFVNYVLEDALGNHTDKRANNKVQVYRRK